VSFAPTSIYADIRWTRTFSTSHLFSPASPTSTPGRPRQSREICVIGAGVSGLTAAYELAKGEQSVTVFESSSRVGGRIKTHHFLSSGGDHLAHAELGAMRIPHDHELVFDYVRELGLPEPRPFVNKNYNGYLYVGDERYRRYEHLEAAEHLWSVLNFPGHLPERLQKDPISLIQTTAKNFKAVLDDGARYSIFNNDILDFVRLRPPTPNDLQAAAYLIGYERQSLWQAITHGVETSIFEDHEWEVLARLALEHPWERASLLEWLVDDLAVHGLKFELERGMDSLPNALAEQMGHRGGTLVLNAEVIRVGVIDLDGARKIEVTFRDSRNQSPDQTALFDYVVCAIPPSPTVRIKFDQMTMAKYNALTATTFLPSAKAAILCPKRYWELNDGIAGGSSITDQEIQQAWYPSDNAVLDPDPTKSIFSAPHDETMGRSIEGTAECCGPGPLDRLIV